MYRLLILDPPAGTPAFLALKGDVLRVGREPDSDLVLDRPAVSRKHALLHSEAGAWWVEDLGGGNGTYLNGLRIDKAWLKPGDRLHIGEIELVFEVPPASAPPPVPTPHPTPPPLPALHSTPPPLPPLVPRPLLAPPPLPGRPQTKSKSRTGFWVALSVCLLLLLAGAWLLRDRFMPGGGMAGFLSFREDAGKAPREAFAKARAPERLTELNQVLWPTVEPEAGWTFFFRTCLVTGGTRKGDRQAVLFYHPWSDTALLTQWKNQERLIELEMVPGEALRKGGARPYGGTLGWTRLQAYAPPAVGMVTAQTLKAFEHAFSAETGLYVALPGLAQAQAREACRLASSLQFAQVVKSLTILSDSYDQPARLAFIRLLALGGEAPATAPGTPPDSANALRALPGAAWSGFQPTALVDTNARVLILAHHRGSPDLYLGVVFRREGVELVPERMDLLSFNACYGALK